MAIWYNVEIGWSHAVNLNFEPNFHAYISFLDDHVISLKSVDWMEIIFAFGINGKWNAL